MFSDCSLGGLVCREPRAAVRDLSTGTEGARVPVSWTTWEGQGQILGLETASRSQGVPGAEGRPCCHGPVLQEAGCL